MSDSPRVGMLMGSISDREVMQAAADLLTQFGVPFDWRVSSAHRTPADTHEFASTARERGIEVLICGAGSAAHLAGVVAATTTLPVLGVPIGGSFLGLDALLATVQMPGGIPVASFAVGRAGAKNAALMAIAILALHDERLAAELTAYRASQVVKVRADNVTLQGSLD